MKCTDDKCALIDWTAERERLQAEVEALRETIKDLGWRHVKIPPESKHQFSILFQRRHRKWALTKAREWWYWFVNYRDDNIRWEHERAEKAEADNAKLVGALERFMVWYDDDDYLGNTVEIFEHGRAVLKEVADAST